MFKRKCSHVVLETYIYVFVAAFILSQCTCNDITPIHIHIAIEDQNQTGVLHQLNAMQIRLMNLEANTNVQLQSLSSDVRQLLLNMRQQQTIESYSSASPINRPSKAPPIGCETIGHLYGSDVYRIRGSESGQPFDAFCQTVTLFNQQPAWTMILRRSNSDVDFYRNWEAYENGFGNVTDDHWIGLKRLHEITEARPHELRIELEDFNGKLVYAFYARFAIAGKDQHYALNTLGKYTGTAGDSLRYHVGQKFSTFDADHDSYEGNCAKILSGAGWYNRCTDCNLFGSYLYGESVRSEDNGKGIYWNTFCDASCSLWLARMMIRAI